MIKNGKWSDTTLFKKNNKCFSSNDHAMKKVKIFFDKISVYDTYQTFDITSWFKKKAKKVRFLTHLIYKKIITNKFFLIKVLLISINIFHISINNENMSVWN